MEGDAGGGGGGGEYGHDQFYGDADEAWYGYEGEDYGYDGF